MRRRKKANDDQFDLSLRGHQPIRPLTASQKAYRQAIERFPMTVALGPAGTGKTFVASTVAADLLLDGIVERIIICRPAVPVEGEQHGFLPGTLRHKLEPWAWPVVDALEERLGRQKVEELLKGGTVEAVPLAFLQGRTFKRAFVILDEAQNTSVGQMKMFVTRIGQDCKVVVNGDVKQQMVPMTSGLGVALQLAQQFPGLSEEVAVVEFTNADIVRSGLCQKWVRAFETYIPIP